MSIIGIGMASPMMNTSAVSFQHMMASLSLQQQNSSSPTAVRKICGSETIHSGHFMVSEIDDSEQQEVPKLSHEFDYDQQMLYYDLQVNAQQCKQTTQTYYYTKNDGSVVMIDGSFTKLFECMSLAYSGEITSPRWNTFRGLKLSLKDKIRLNNIIWREWHIQSYVDISERKPMVCQFSSPIDADTHKKPETVVLEGKYWKRRLDSVTAEYQTWRMYYRKIIGRPQTPTPPSYFDWENRWPVWSTNSNSGFFSNDDYSMDFTDDSLFTTLLQPNLIDFPNIREIARPGMGAEFMQPSLVQLQPTLEDFMDTFEPLQELFFQSSNMKTVWSTSLPEETTVDYTNANVADSSKICDSISEVSSQIDSLILNTLLNESQLANVASLQTMQSNVMYESILESNATNEPQINAEFRPRI